MASVIPSSGYGNANNNANNPGNRHNSRLGGNQMKAIANAVNPSTKKEDLKLKNILLRIKKPGSDNASDCRAFWNDVVFFDLIGTMKKQIC
ncbi:hypothetical protein RFI_19943 [Reticulomyxa filosa]|uniref:Uncharacterized protein n=1 Tax=Reticulomyxa filosa TaxID=46433 RepID=X6MWD9_RETFI|nr:hypothetical protein RFI_19943 [Reticulomyxa filosa]|eukprot:ETO17380.1 hypothetical protein RFI_19943 [Reticulomyxa filosa]